MSEMRLEPPTSLPPSPPPIPPPDPGQPGGSLAAGVGLAWAVMIIGEVLVVMTSSFGTILGGLLPPVAIIVWGLVLLMGDKPRTGKGLLLGLLSVIAVVLLLVAACFGLVSGFR